MPGASMVSTKSGRGRLFGRRRLIGNTVVEEKGTSLYGRIYGCSNYTVPFLQNLFVVVDQVFWAMELDGDRFDYSRAII